GGQLLGVAHPVRGRDVRPRRGDPAERDPRGRQRRAQDTHSPALRTHGVRPPARTERTGSLLINAAGPRFIPRTRASEASQAMPLPEADHVSEIIAVGPTPLEMGGVKAFRAQLAGPLDTPTTDRGPDWLIPDAIRERACHQAHREQEFRVRTLLPL